MPRSSRATPPPEVGPSPPRVWTLPEATARLPMLRELVAELKGWLARRRAIRSELDRLAAFWGPEWESHDQPDRDLHDRLAAEFEDLTRRLERAVGALSEEGIEVKDLEEGLLDFYSRRDGELVFLCWRDGEPEIAFFHTLTGGFLNRRPIVEKARGASAPGARGAGR